ncbi:monoacylglycerol lipase ABHD2-like isoform X2 [Tubulanus polymorphus]|uniref:monoacylglycerol lipase ABHD2-like isoform X2 n=1 Tax=Tubulanus polymorphus TaxID=672921 RepID=UPI003DA5E66C
MADLLWLAAVILIILLFFRVFHFASRTEPPVLYHQHSQFVNEIISSCSLLSQPYVPPFFWGKSGHVQTIVYGKMGRIKPPLPRGTRIERIMPDGATLTFDIFEPLKPHPTKGDYTMLICPGIANSSESTYIRTLIDHVQNNGFRAAVLNHLGSLKDVKLTSPRIYTYGGTDEYKTMVEYVSEYYSGSTLIAVGCSMGANVISKYLGENPNNQKLFLCGLSICQGYDLHRMSPFLLSFEHLRRVYIYAMTLHQVSLLKRNADVLFGGENSGKYDVNRIFKSTDLKILDELYSRRRAGFTNLLDYYAWCSSSNYINNISIPMLMLNALDDPLVPPDMFDIPKSFIDKNDKSLFVVTKHGGHLGFFESAPKNRLLPRRVTWLDKVIVDYANAVINVNENMASF